jgi:asparagine synthase (glutamine-hydrolysing)
MCGIVGYLNFEGLEPDRSPLRAMCAKIEHRGPDGYGEFFDTHAALGHRRLSIIDLQGGSQPLANEDGSIQVAFNGEIYNYRELRRHLVSCGHTFKTQSDTEVLVHLYEEVGERLPEYLNGMFAFAIWDAPARKLFLARDRFGEKPLYYTLDVHNLSFCFASEIKAFSALPGFQTKFRPESIADYLCFYYIPDPDTIYEGVHRLRAGHSLMVTESGLHMRQYWAPAFQDDVNISMQDAAEQIRELSSDCVRRRMVSDVPLGAFLSGGVDSSAVVAFMSQQTPRSVRTFSIGFTTPQFDEVPYARMIARRYQTQHYERVVSPSIQEMLSVAVHHYDEPFADASAIPMLYVAKLTREHVTVALSGDGADEVFGGYRRYRHGVLEANVRRMMPQWFRTTVIRVGAQAYPQLEFAPQVFRAKTVLTNISLTLADAYFNAVSGFRGDSLQSVLAPDLRAELRLYSPQEAWRKRFAKVSHLSPFRQMQAVDMETYLPADILVKVDRATMAYSLESRAPWLDHRLAELAASLPSAFHLNVREGKLAFKRALAPLLPAPILSRSKMGFSVPLSDWFRTSLKSSFERLVFHPEMEAYLAPAEVRQLWQEHQSGVRSHGHNLWAVFMLACWRARESAHGSTEFAETAALAD